MENNIKKITLIKNARFRNMLEKSDFPAEKALEIEMENGDIHILSSVSQKDFLGVDYIKLIDRDKEKRKIIFWDC